MEEYQVEFPNIAIDYMQFKKTLDRTIKLFAETGSLLRKAGNRAPKKRTPVVIAHAEEMIMKETPKMSIRQLHQLNLSVGTTHKRLRKNLEVYPYHSLTCY